MATETKPKTAPTPTPEADVAPTPKKVRVTIKRGVVNYYGDVYYEGNTLEVDEESAKVMKESGNI